MRKGTDLRRFAAEFQGHQVGQAIGSGQHMPGPRPSSLLDHFRAGIGGHFQRNTHGAFQRQEAQALLGKGMRRGELLGRTWAA